MVNFPYDTAEYSEERGKVVKSVKAQNWPMTLLNCQDPTGFGICPFTLLLCIKNQLVLALWREARYNMALGPKYFMFLDCGRGVWGL